MEKGQMLVIPYMAELIFVKVPSYYFKAKKPFYSFFCFKSNTGLGIIKSIFNFLSFLLES